MAYYLRFQLRGETALWRNPYESMGSFSCLGPAPSALAGLLGAALGFAAPRSAGAVNPDERQLTALQKKGLLWPLSGELLKWEEENDIQIACRWSGANNPRRIPWNVNGIKELSQNDNLRIQQQLIFDPSYETVVKFPTAEAAKTTEAALKRPAFPLYLGQSFCRAIIAQTACSETFDSGKNWAFPVERFPVGEATPLSRHQVNPELNGERMKIQGYWVYPLGSADCIRQENAFVRTWYREL